MQKTLKTSTRFYGIGLHSGKQVTMTILPARIGAGIVFRRVDLRDQPLIDARFNLVSDTRLNTRIAAGGAEVSTIEHLMAAFAGLGISNALVEIDGPEVPVLDGSSLEYVREFLQTGIEEQNAPILSYNVQKSVRVEGENGAFAELHPSEVFEIDFTIDFAKTAIGHQHLNLDMRNGVFLRELANCRTFCRLYEVEALQKMGLAQGGSLDNALVFDGDKVLNHSGLRHKDECVRHKMLDALGDLYLAGGPIIGRYIGHMSGHGLTNKLLRRAFEEGALQAVAAIERNLPLFPGYNISLDDLRAA